MKLEFFRVFFSKKYSNIKFHENPSGWSGVIQWVRTHMNLIVAFRNSAKAPANRARVALKQNIVNIIFLKYRSSSSKVGVSSSAVGSGTELQAGRSWIWFPMGSLECFIDWILPVALWPWARISPGDKGSRCVGLTTLPPTCADCPEILEASASWRVG
jgi:hypothetical protein